MIKIIFLDIDGVLNNKIMHDFPDRIKTVCSHSMDKRCIELLNKLTDETGAKIVISSSLRLGKTVDKLKEEMALFGITGPIIDKTPNINGVGIYRGNEIARWILNNADSVLNCPYYNFKRYVIIDDDSDMLLWQSNNFVQTDHFAGMTDRTFHHAKKILNGTNCSDDIF